MAGMILVDTDWIIDALRGVPTAIDLLQRLAPLGLAVSMISYGALYEGGYYERDWEGSLAGLHAFLDGKDLLPVTAEVAARFAIVRGGLSRQLRHQIGDMDLLIAATALRHDLTLATRNRRDFQHSPALHRYRVGWFVRVRVPPMARRSTTAPARPRPLRRRPVVDLRPGRRADPAHRLRRRRRRPPAAGGGGSGGGAGVRPAVEAKQETSRWRVGCYGGQQRMRAGAKPCRNRAAGRPEPDVRASGPDRHERASEGGATVKVIVTGGSGRAGREVVRTVAEAGHEVVNLDAIAPAAALGLPGAFCRVDLTDAGAVYDAFCQVRPDGVCHLAAKPSPSGQAQVDVFDTNVRSAYRVMQAAGDLGVRRVVYASSEMATGLLTGARPSRIPFDEGERHPSPNAYALSKYLAEVIAESLAVRFPATAFVGLRINNVILPDGYHVLAERRADPRKGMANFWSYVDARDVGGAFLAALDGESSGHEVFLVAAADTSAARPLRELMAEYHGAGELVAPGHGDFASAFDCGKMERVFGWTPRYSWRNRAA